MKRNLTFLTAALSKAVCQRIWREALDSLQETLWSGVLLRQNFTLLGATQFMRDVQAILSLVDRHISEGSAAMLQLEEGARLLSLPMEAEQGGATLKEASDRMFTDNAEARKALEELGIHSLDPASARRILQRRVENSE